MRMVEAMRQDSSNMVGEFYFFIKGNLDLFLFGVFVC